MKRYFPFLGFSAVLLVYFQSLQAGQISVINPSAGSEITGIVSVSPQPSSLPNSSGGAITNNINLGGETGQFSSKYQIYYEFFKSNSFEKFTKDQLLIIKSKLLEVSSSHKIENDIMDLIQEQLVLVAQHIQ